MKMFSFKKFDYLGATAGLRLLNITNPNYVNNLLINIRTYFSTLGLLFNAPENQVRMISGSEEGLSGWISANMLMKQLFYNNQPSQTYGVFDMGGMLIINFLH
jgi:Golgi nucleoside diphosphatase